MSGSHLIMENEDYGIGARCEKHNYPFAPCVYCQLETQNALVDKLTNLLELETAENETLTDALKQIRTWASAYPLAIFPEPDFVKAAAVLKENGMTLDAISASNMRHVLDGVMRIVDAALGERE